MDDKPPELAALLEKVYKTLDAHDKAMNEQVAVNKELVKTLQDFQEQQKAWFQREISRLAPIPTTSQYLASRFTRRDGDGFATVPRKFGSADSVDVNDQRASKSE